MVLFFKNHQITIMRPHSKGGIKYAYSATFTAYNTDIQPLQAERVMQMGGRIGKLYDAFIDATVDIKEGDRVVTEGNKQYVVKAVSKFSGAGLLDHIQLLIESQD